MKYLTCIVVFLMCHFWIYSLTQNIPYFVLNDNNAISLSDEMIQILCKAEWKFVAGVDQNKEVRDTIYYNLNEINKFIFHDFA